MEISRRAFIGGSVVAAILGAIGLKMRERRLDTIEEGRDKKVGPLVEGTWKPTGCLGCTSWCAKEAFIVDGRAIKIRANKVSKIHGGHDCPRAHLAIQQVYDPDRIKQPMKRTNPKKGLNEDPGFVPISWDEAMDILADKIMELRKNDETYKFAVFRGRYTNINGLLYSNLPKIIGSPNNISHSSICAEAEKFGPYYTQGYWNYRDYDVENTKYIICWGVDPLCSNRQVSHYLNVFGQLLERGVKIVTIDPKYSNTAAKSHVWMPVKPGQDGALATAMAHVILTEGLWSKEFVGDFKDGQNRFVTGKTVDEELFEENHTFGLVKWWNLELKDRTPEWAEEVCGVDSETIKNVAIEFAKAGPYAMVFMGGGSNMQIRGGYNSMAVHALNGLVGSVDHEGGTLTGRSPRLQSLPKPDDFMDEMAQRNSKKQKIDQRGYKEFPALKDGKSGGGVVTNRVADAILAEDPYKLKVILAYFCNFNYSCPETKRWHEAMAKVDFLAHCVTHYSEMSHFADLLLPSTHHSFEQMSSAAQKANSYTHLWINERLIDPVYDVKNPETEIPWLLGEKLAQKGFTNLLDYLKTYKDPETGKEPTNPLELELYTLKIRTQPIWDPAKYEETGNHGDKFNSWQEFIQKGIWNSAPYQFKKLWSNMPTETGKFEFYSATLKKALESHAEKHKTTVDDILKTCKYEAKGELAFVPHYEEPYMVGSKNDYPFDFIDAKSRLAREGRSANCSWFQEFKDSDPGDIKWGDCIKMNPDDAERLGLKDGDKVKVISPVGEVVTTLKLWEALRPGTVQKTFGQGHWAMGHIAAEDFAKRIPRGSNNNDIMAAEYERLSGSTAFYGSFRVRIEKA
ncbi:Anaerobic selenocysteine-containing dehydrogenase [Anaerobranca californiensis DSM 14826]|uniref:Anaerobic selenocysteine-containing dehydrogenase n=1 Tax=Anaerobranca californiensis DSM 14826 TaxID=1120989 RepID=A0A1M6LKH2_9FIRM|nr:molybdopterin-dependent oxidoreductase [Anaerobranca californiensis]SHJ71680.1 Anaerobic selenocysteine-containing dehydrogenase [Anaerobranca californiensis DSM 14826]